MAACGNDSSSETSDAATTEPTSPSTTEARPYEVFVPTGYDAATAAPLVISLHGYGAFGELQELYFQLEPQAEERGFLYVHPDGTVDPTDMEFWNATDACCDETQSVDDSGYINFIIDEVSAAYNIDPARIYLVGHSNGGFMSYRMACDYADRIAAIVSLAGATFLDTSRCAPSEPVSILQIHGTADDTIKYDGGRSPLSSYPAAETTVAMWSAYNGCAPATEPLGAIDLESGIDGDETTMEAFTDCPVDGAVELWTMAGGSHTPALAANFAADVIDWLYAHPKV